MGASAVGKRSAVRPEQAFRYRSLEPKSWGRLHPQKFRCNCLKIPKAPKGSETKYYRVTLSDWPGAIGLTDKAHTWNDNISEQLAHSFTY